MWFLSFIKNKSKYLHELCSFAKTFAILKFSYVTTVWEALIWNVVFFFLWSFCIIIIIVVNINDPSLGREREKKGEKRKGGRRRINRKAGFSVLPRGFSRQLEGCIFLRSCWYYYSRYIGVCMGRRVYIGRVAAFAGIREARPGPAGFSKGPVTSRLLGRSKYLNLTPRSRGREAPALLGLGGP